MAEFPPSNPSGAPNQGVPGAGTPGADPRLQPTPDYGTLGPGSDISGYPRPSAPRKTPVGAARLIAIAIGMIGAFVAANRGSGQPLWPDLANLFSGSEPATEAKPASPKTAREIDRLLPQQQAETLLEMAVAHSPGAVEQISARATRWKGGVQWNAQIANLSTAALNSDDLRVRESGVEVELAAYGLAKNSASLEYLVKTVDSNDHAQKIWALWALGLLGNRGVETDQVVDVLTSHLKDPDVDSRHWAVEALALTGSDATIQPLLQAMHDDPSPLVRERAACGIASSGLFTPQQRMTAVPTLLVYTDDPSLDAQTHAWAFQALSDITHQRFGNDPAAWRRWYQSR